jgi:hypothetical protein
MCDIFINPSRLILRITWETDQGFLWFSLVLSLMPEYCFKFSHDCLWTHPSQLTNPVPSYHLACCRCCSHVNETIRRCRLEATHRAPAKRRHVQWAAKPGSYRSPCTPPQSGAWEPSAESWSRSSQSSLCNSVPKVINCCWQYNSCAGIAQSVQWQAYGPDNRGIRVQFLA